MKKSWLIRKDQEGVSPVIATILMVAITVVLAAVLYVMVTYWINPGRQQIEPIAFNVQSTGTNWTMLVISAPSGLLLNSVTMTITDPNGGPVEPMSSVSLSQLTSDNWDTYKVVYWKQKVDDNAVSAGSRILVDRTKYPAGSHYTLVSGSDVVGNGVYS